jgi:hypothetical protein
MLQDVPHRPGAGEWFCHELLKDGSIYLRWHAHFEFLVSADGHRIDGRPLGDTSLEGFFSYLLGQVLSFALIKRGIDPLHSTAAVVDGEAVSFIGDCGYGKSSLGAAFLHAGYPLLTDDLLVVQKEDQGFVAYPGPPRIKLFPEVVARFLGETTTGTQMNRETTKLIIPLNPHQSCLAAAPLRAIYVLQPPSERSRVQNVSIGNLRPGEAQIALIANAFNTRITTPDRLTRQFHQAARLAAGIPIKSLSYPQDLEQLPDVVKAIRSDMARN